MSATKAAQPLRVAVTGGSGRIGSHVVKQLVERGHHVINIDRRQAAKPLARFVFLDLRKRELVQPVFENVDAICHLAEIPNINAGYSHEEVFAHNTAVGSIVLQTAADLNIKRVIYTSTMQVYGCWGYHFVPPVKTPIDETHPFQPTNQYALGKVANEEYARLVSRQQGLSVAIFRFPGVLDFPPDQSVEETAKQWIERATGRVEGFNSYVYAGDAARAFVLALENPRPGCEAYHFTAPEVISAMPLRERLAKTLPEWPKLLPDNWPAFKTPVDCSKAKAHFGWEPSVNLVEIYRKKYGREPGA